MTHNHTPGPWTMHEEREDENENEHRVIITATNNPGFGVICHQYRPQPEDIANFKLIQEAPELLRALIELRVAMREHLRLDVKKHFSLLNADAAAAHVIWRITQKE